VATLNVIRRWAVRENMSIREISRRTGMARNTVKKYLRSDETEPTYAKRVSSSKLDPFAEMLSTWPGMEATKSRKLRRNLKQICTTILLLFAQKGSVARFVGLPCLCAQASDNEIR
jgi:IS30 family transposase